VQLLCNHGSKTVAQPPPPVDYGYVQDITDVLVETIPGRLSAVRLVSCECRCVACFVFVVNICIHSFPSLVPILYAHRKTITHVDINLNQRGFNMEIVPVFNQWLLKLKVGVEAVCPVDLNSQSLTLSPIYREHTSMRVLHGILENKCLDEFAVDGYAAPGQIVFAISNMHKVSSSSRNRCLHECACAGYETEEAND
jgi:hypothetical protein